MGSSVRKKPKYLSQKLTAIRERMGYDYTEMGKKLSEIIKQITDQEILLRRSDIWKFEAAEREPNLLVLLGYAKLAKVSTDLLIDDREKLPD